MNAKHALKTALAGATAATVLVAGIPAAAHAQSACAQSAAFESLRAQAGNGVVGTFTGCQYNEAGDLLMPTSTGLMVWRKADNWTGFTNGSRTWMLTPTGIADRANDQRFAWESDYGAPGTVPYAPPAPPPPPPADPEPLVAGTQLGVPVTGPVLTMTATGIVRVPGGTPGNRLLKVTVKVEPGTTGNNRGRVGKYDYWDFRLRSPQGVEYRPSVLYAGRPGALSEGTLFRDQFVVGDLYFEVPDDGQGFGLHHYPQGYTTPELAISRWLGGVA